MAKEKQKRITFFSNKPVNCPVCGENFYREDLLSRGGRLIASDLTDELRRLYQPSVVYGEVFPLIYSVIVCPACYYSAYPEDFSQIQGEIVLTLESNTHNRKQNIGMLFKNLNFKEPRELKEGVASYFFAIACYDFFPKHFSPTFKRALSALRAAWLLTNLHRKYPDENYDYLSKMFYHKAHFFYLLTLERDQSGKEGLKQKANYGPDTDKNYGYDGILYLSAILEYKFGFKKDKEKRIKSLENAKRLFSKLFGMGKASKDKPSAILEKAKDIYSQIGEEINSLQGGT